jgi:hypothetical protein
MIPSTTNQLLVTEDWKKIYQSYKNSDFKSYDFNTLRRTMITYLRENYPEDFNDFIDSSEYVALIDLIAYLGQNLSFRIDLNARENFLETAERRESVLRLARLINYNAKRNVAASGLLKIVSVQTTDQVFDSNGNNLSGSPIGWNDPTNVNWYEQYISVLNSTMPLSMSYGKPAAKNTINGISTEKYTINSANDGVPVYSISKSINGIGMNFEIVSSTFDTTISEDIPRAGNQFSFLYRNDNRGNGSGNTGFFVQFKQGSLGVANFTIDNPVPNEVIGINTPDINDSDVWLWQMNPDGSYPLTPWTKVSATSGNNVIYNSLSENVRNLYSVVTRENDQIDLNFADGSFGNLPKGQFKLFYRQSNGISYSIKPSQLSGITVTLDYVNSAGQPHTLTLLLSLENTVSNSSPTETNDNIKIKAPQAFYSQNRMVTAEDYNIMPLTAGTDILKVKSINRVSSGVSKYFEMSDVTGKYSDVTLYGTDGILYKELKDYYFEYLITTSNDIKYSIKNNLSKVFNLKEFRSFYLENYSRPSFSGYNLSWVQSTKTTNQNTGYFTLDGKPTPTGTYSSNNLKYALVGSLIKFVPPARYNPALRAGTPPQPMYFLPSGKLTFIPDSTTTSVKWVKVVSIVTDGYNGGAGALATGIGPVILTGNIPSGAVPVEVISKFVSVPPDTLENTIVKLSLTKKNFGISLDQETNSWYIVSDTNVDLLSPFSLINQKDTSDRNRDASWMVAFEWTGVNYKARYRVVEYIFESENETGFYVDETVKNYDYTNDTVIKDKITVLGINPDPVDIAGNPMKVDSNWQIDSSVIEPDGYQEPKKVKVSFFDKDDDGQLDNPDSFVDIVRPESTSTQTTFKTKFVFFKRLSDGLRYIKVDASDFYSYPKEINVPSEFKIDGQLFYFYDQSVDVIKRWSASTQTFNLETDYFAKPGRSNIKFQYTHKTSDKRRLDPSKTNLMDIYLLTNTYDIEFRNWLTLGSGAEPQPPTSQSLDISYSSVLEPIKSISDELIFHPTNYKVLFGDKAAPMLQATFKASRNIYRSNSDNALKTRILTAIENFFAIDNWTFGQTFYFSELATYVMNIMTPDITNFVIVPKQQNAFGSLFEIKCASNEIFVSGATIFDIDIIDSITSSELKSAGTVVNSVGGQR